MVLVRDTLHTLRYLFEQCTAALTLCITASRSRGGTVPRVSGHAAMSPLLHYPEPTAAHHSSLGGQGPLPPRWRPFSQDPRTLPPHSSEHFPIPGDLVVTLLSMLEFD
jgi:hypothetical protein